MIGVEEARRLLIRSIVPLPVKEVPLHKAFGHHAAADVLAAHDHPLFNNSAVDGYAFAFNDSGGELRVVQHVAAGAVPQRKLVSGECARIFTGAVMPAGADTVVMQEFVTRHGDRIVHTDNKLQHGGNVRLRGEQVKAGDLVLKKGGCLDPVVLGLLASVGTGRVKVHEWPYVSVVITGNEFTEKDGIPVEGRIFSSNDIMLEAALRRAGLRPVMHHAADNREELEDVLRQAMSESDLVITTGGVSVGDHDLVPPVFQALGGELIFHKVAQKPGKPMLLGRHGNSTLIGLPGNPRAVMVLFWEYVLPAIKAMMGSLDPWPVTQLLPLKVAVTLKGDRAEFRAARIRNGMVELLRDEGSHMLASLTRADALAFFPSTIRSMDAHEMIETHLIPR